MSLQELQEEIVQNRIRRGFPSAHDLSKTTKGLEEELEEWKQALAAEDVEEQVDALGDLTVFCLGGLKILGYDAQTVLNRIVGKNKTRTHKKVH